MDDLKKGLTSNERFDSAIISRAEPSRAVKSASRSRVLLPTTA